MAWLLIGGLVMQFYAAGLMVYGAPRLHQELGYVVLLAAAIWAGLAGLGMGWGRDTKLAVALVGVLVAQPVIVFVLAERSLYLAALHPVNGLLAFTIVLETLWRPRGE